MLPYNSWAEEPKCNSPSHLNGEQITDVPFHNMSCSTQYGKYNAKTCHLLWSRFHFHLMWYNFIVVWWVILSLIFYDIFWEMYKNKKKQKTKQWNLNLYFDHIYLNHENQHIYLILSLIFKCKVLINNSCVNREHKIFKHLRVKTSDR